MSVADIFDHMESYYRRKGRDAKQKLSMLFVLAESTAEHIGTYLNSENTARAPWDFYPELFKLEKDIYEKEEIKRQTNRARENRRAYAKEIKKRRELGLM